MTSAFELQPATDGHWPRAWEIQRDAFRALTRRVGLDIDTLEAECRAEWRAHKTRLIVQDEIIGFVRVEHHPDHDWLDLIALAPAHQGAGLGARVMRHLMDEAACRGVPLWLSVYRANEACRLYRRLGFAERERDRIRLLMVFPPEHIERPPRGAGKPR
jgi:ribosomal protein S18 acetylase RimI-like enzyme